LEGTAAERQQGNHVPRNLVIVRAGDQSLHEDWLGDGSRNFDLVVSYYGDDPNRFRRINTVRLDHKGGKFDGLHRLLSERPEFLSNYDYVWLPDDDIAADAATIDRLFAIMAEFDLLIAQPALSWDSYFAFPATLRFPGFRLRYSSTVEPMVPCFAAPYLRRVLPLFDGLRFAWGIDFIWTRLMPEPRNRAAIIDEAVVRHTRRFGTGSLYQSDIRPAAERRTLQKRFGIDAVPPAGVYGGVTEAGGTVALDRASLDAAARAIWSKLPPAILGRWSRRHFSERFIAGHPGAVDLSPMTEIAGS
jgi:hypothetical protein